jgi:glycosyltransferase involved in cell wall biosynthesis
MIRELSILIPTFNQVCTSLVESLASQASQIEGLDYEIIVADDGSTLSDSVETNKRINTIEHSRYLIRPQNVGRAAIRNILAQAACHEWLLFLDSDVAIMRADFLRTYLHTKDNAKVIYGGISIGGEAEQWSTNLRYRYEKSCEAHHVATLRSQHPYQSFRTTNFLVQRNVMLACPFDSHIKSYGYEDVLFGKELRRQDIRILHLDNQATYLDYEENEEFVGKTEESLRTLSAFANQLEGYSRLLAFAKRIHALHISALVLCVFKGMKTLWRRNLCGKAPSLLVFKLYKTGYFISIHRYQ